MKLALVEDNALLRDHLAILLDGEPGISVIGTYGSGEEALPGVIESPPDVLLVDLGLPSMSGLELVEKVKRKMPELDVMVHTVFDSRESVFAAIKAGAAGYMLKGGSIGEVTEALFCLHEGGASMSPKIARTVRREFHKQAVEQHNLTFQEQTILQGLEDGLTYKELAQDQHVSLKRIHSVIKNIYRKLYDTCRE